MKSSMEVRRLGTFLLLYDARLILILVRGD